MSSANKPAQPGLIDQLELGAALQRYFADAEQTEVVLLNVEVHCSGNVHAAQAAVAQVLLKYCRPTDSVARISASRFMIACAGIGRSSAFELAELLRLRINSDAASGGTGQQAYAIHDVGIGISGSFSNYQRAGIASHQSQRALEQANAIGGISLAYRNALETV